MMTTGKGLMQTEDSEYVRLVSLISGVWDKAKNDAALAVNTELLDASWETGRYIVEFEQGGKAKARYGEQLITNLAKDLTRMRGRGFSRSNLIYMRKFYLTFPKSETLSHKILFFQAGNYPSCALFGIIIKLELDRSRLLKYIVILIQIEHVFVFLFHMLPPFHGFLKKYTCT